MRYKQVLKNPIVFCLSLVQLISYFGTWFSQVAIFSLLVMLGADELTIALTAAMNMLPAVILAPLIGVYIDRIAFKPLALTLIGVEIGTTIGFIFIDHLSQIPWLMVLIFLRSTAASTLFSAQMALFAKILEGETLKRTNEIHAIIWSFTYASGMAIGGLVAHRIGIDGAFITDALLYCIALALLVSLRLKLTPPKHPHTSTLHMIKDALRYLKHRPKLISIIFLHASVGLTSFDTLVTLLADKAYKEIIAVPLAIGMMHALRAIGLSIGPLLIAKYIDEARLYWLLIAQGLAIILWALTQQSFLFSLVSMLLIGLFTTTLWSYTYMMLQQNCDKDYIGRIISYNDMIFMLSNIATAMFVGTLATYGVPLWLITAFLGFGFIVTALWYRHYYLKRFGALAKGQEAHR